MELDPSQQRAVDFHKGQVIVIAGAGSGKTRVLTERIGRLIERGEKPESILAFTFTNAAADEMKSRLLTKIGLEAVEKLNIGTMHSQLNKILKKNISFWKPDMYGYKIMDDYASRILIKDAMKACDLPEDNMVNIANAGICIAFIKNNAMAVDEVVDGKADLLFKKLGVDFWFPDFFMTFERMRRSQKMIGFDDMLWETYFLLKEKVNILNTYAKAFNFISVDEFQDTNRVQFEIVKMLQSKHENLFVVGDPRQAIYGFRQADVTLSLQFKDHFPKAEVIELEYNYRCASNIVEMTNDLISNADYPFMRTKFVKEDGRIDFVGGFEDDNDEAEAITEEIKALNADGAKYADMVVLNRTNAQSRPFEEKFVKNRIPYKAVDGTFYESANVKDMLCYLDLIIGDSMDAFKRVYNRPNRFLGKVFFEQFEERMRGGRDLLSVLRLGGFSKGYMNKSAGAFAMELLALRRNAEKMNPGQAIGVIRRTFAYDDWVRQNDMDFANRIEILNELQSSAESYNNIAEYLQFVKALVAAQKNDEDFDAVRIMTVHRSKGLEFPIVFTAGVSEGVLPHARAEDVDEERRLCYVALTRAIDRLYVSYFLKRFNKTLAPSRFLAEMLLEKYCGKTVMPTEEVAAEEEPALVV
jgi:DNA helicase II / ATP-dependent DNA helicase PcrA